MGHNIIRILKEFRRSNNKKTYLREKLNPVLGPIRRILLKDTTFSIISNNCWGGVIYRHFHLPYQSPTIGLFFYASDFVEFCSRLSYYVNLDIEFIPLEKSKHREDLIRRSINCPIGKLDDIEIIFLHYSSEEEARDKWNRRKQRINYQNLIFKMSEQNNCTYTDLFNFDSLKYKKKILFTSKSYGLKSEVIFHVDENTEFIQDDITHFKRFINLSDFINQSTDKE